MKTLRETVQKHWGFKDFLPLQEQAIQSVLDNHDSLVVLPTGGGKSLCFQAPALCMEGTAFIISPLIALMKDQVDALQARGIQAGCLNSLSTPDERQELARLFRSGRLRLLYIAPERLLTEPFLAFLDRTKVSFFAIDEAHCISTWGHDFRPDYRGLQTLKQRYPNTPIHAYTATATPKVREDIVNQLGLCEPEVLVGSFDRPNLIFRVLKRTKGLSQVLGILERHHGESGIIYCLSRQKTEDLAAALQTEGYSAAAYHAGLSDEERKRNQDAFIHQEVKTIVATVAFGMGIDKANVRYVIHVGMPKSLESYQQESGRAGRDGQPAECWLLYSYGDLVAWKKRSTETDPQMLQAAFSKLDAMYSYCSGHLCRHHAILRYFGQESRHRGCAGCDICLGHLEPWHPTQEDLSTRKRIPRHSTKQNPKVSPAKEKVPQVNATKEIAFELFTQRRSIEEAVNASGRARTTVCQYLVDFISLKGITDPTPWVHPEVVSRVCEAAKITGMERLTPIRTYLKDEFGFDEISIARACLKNLEKQNGV